MCEAGRGCLFWIAQNSTPVWVSDLFSHLTTNNMMDKVDTERFTIIASKTCVLNTPNHGTVGATYLSEDAVEFDDTEAGVAARLTRAGRATKIVSMTIPGFITTDKAKTKGGGRSEVSVL